MFLTNGARLDPAGYARGTWAGGTTRGIWSAPAAALGAPAGALAWAGTAVIERAAPYSHFAGLARIQIPIQGRGLRLQFADPDELVALERLGQRQFDGARPVVAEPQGGPVTAFNLIFRRDVVAEAAVVDVGAGGLRWSPQPPPRRAADRVAVRIVYVISGALSLQLPGGAAASLGPDEAYLLAPAPAAEPGPGPALAAPRLPAEVILATFWLPGA